MSKKINIDLVNQLASKGNLLEQYIENQIQKVEMEVSHHGKGIVNRLFNLFLSHGKAKMLLSEEEVKERLKNLVLKEDLIIALDGLVDSGLLQETENGKLKMASNVMVHHIYSKMEAESRNLRKVVEAFIEDHFKREHYLTEKDLNYIDRYLGQIDISDEEKGFVEKSKDLIRRKKNRRKWIITVVISALSILATVALFQYWKAEKSNRDLEIANQELDQEKYLVEQQNIEIDNQRKIAVDNERKAKKSEELAKEQERFALIQEKKAKKTALLAIKERAAAEAAKKDAFNQKEEADRQRIRAKKNEDDARKHAQEAKDAAAKAQEEELKAKEAEEQVKLLNKIILSYNVAGKSAQMYISEGGGPEN